MNVYTSTQPNQSVQFTLPTQSSWDREWQCDIQESYVETVTKRTVYVLFSVLGVFGNIFVIVLAIKSTVRKKVHYLIINMAVADALFLLLRLLDGIPWLSNYKWMIYERVPRYKIQYKITLLYVTTRLLLFASYRVSLVTLLVISIERFRATRRTLQMPRPSTKKHLVKVVGACWLVPMIAAACELFFSVIIVFRVFYRAMTIISAFICCVISLLSILTIRRLSRSYAIQNNISEEQRAIRARKSRGAVQMVLVSVLLYFCSWIPILIYTIFQNRTSTMSVGINDDYEPCPRTISMIILFSFLPAINALLSPVIYVIFLKEFREATKNALCCRESRVNQAPNNSCITELQIIPNPKRGRRRHPDRENENVELSNINAVCEARVS